MANQFANFPIAEPQDLASLDIDQVLTVTVACFLVMRLAIAKLDATDNAGLSQEVKGEKIGWVSPAPSV